MPNSPPFTITNTILKLVAGISENMGRLSYMGDREQDLRLRKINLMRTVHGSLAIEGNTLSEQQITAIIEGKRVIASIREVKEAHNTINAYEKISTWNASNTDDFLAVHNELMIGLVEQAGIYRTSGVGIMSGDKVVHMAPQAQRVPQLMGDLLSWLDTVAR